MIDNHLDSETAPDYPEPSTNPWGQLTPPPPGQLNANRVDARLKWNFFWALDAGNTMQLVLRHSVQSQTQRSLPNLHDIDITSVPDPADHDIVLAFKLVNPGHRDIFYRLCRDIVDSTRSSETETEAVDITVLRAWRWHRLLKGARTGLLSPRDQMGLIGELKVLGNLLFPVISVSEAVSAWQGPLGSAKDFNLGNMSIESKAMGSSDRKIHIASEYQLDEAEVDTLYLSVLELSPAPANSSNSFCLTDCANQILDTVNKEDAGMVETYESILEASGFSWEHDYSRWQWIADGTEIYRVDDDFPRLTPGRMSEGIGTVRYQIDIEPCSKHRIDRSVIDNRLQGYSG